MNARDTIGATEAAWIIRILSESGGGAVSGGARLEVERRRLAPAVSRGGVKMRTTMFENTACEPGRGDKAYHGDA
jgi:hypothetical protein